MAADSMGAATGAVQMTDLSPFRDENDEPITEAEARENHLRFVDHFFGRDREPDQPE